jgi:quercetin dioxygenase-like cupin family protein
VTEVILKRFEQPDEVRTFEKGRLELIHIHGMTIGRATYDPGWRWTTHVAPVAGTELCEVEHVGMVLSGRAGVLMRNGETYELAAGGLFYVAPGHDSWVIGDEPYVSLHFLGSDSYARGGESQ